MNDLNDRELRELAARDTTIDRLGVRATAEIRRRRATSEAPAEIESAESLRAKLHAAHRELVRRHRRDGELARTIPAIAARLQALAADAAIDLRAPPGGANDSGIDWTGIEGGDR